MTMTTETPASAATPGTGNVTTDPVGPSSVPQETPSSAGPEIAPEETGDLESLKESVRTFQSKADQNEAKYNKLVKGLGDLTPDWIEKLGGGDAVFGMLKHYATHPKFAEFVQEWNASADKTIRTPLYEAQSTVDEEEDEYVDPAVKALRIELEEAKGQIQQLTSQGSARDAEIGSEKFTSHVQEWLSRYEDLTEEEIERVRERGASTINRLGPSIAQLTKENVATLMRDTFTDDEWDAFHAKRALRTLQNQQQRGTDSPSSLSISGQVPENLNKLDPRQVWSEACRRIQS